jgi:hypothetical protein
MYDQSNMQAMQNGKKTLYNLINQKEQHDEEDIAVTSVSTKTNALAIEVKQLGNHIRLNSKYDPIQEAQRWASQYQAKNLDTVVTMFGMGNGIFLRELINHLKQYHYIVVYEPSYAIFSHAIENYSLEDIFLNEKVLLVVRGINDYEYPYFLSRIVTWMNIYSQINCYHPGYEKLFQNSYKYYENTIQDNNFTCMISKNTMDKIGKNLVSNSISNIVYIKNSITFWDLKERLPKDIPVIIVSAGPSLNRNVEILKQAKGKSIIMAVDKAYLTLLRHDIEPDFVVHLDAVKPLSSCGNKVGFTTPLLCLLEGSQQILNNHAGRKVIYECSGFMRRIYKIFGHDIMEVTSGGSVSTSAFALCALARFKRIVLVGSNLAYDGGVSHAGAEYTTFQKNDKLELYVEDIAGNKIRTRYDWYTFLRWYESAIMQMEDFDVINATEVGANIKGARNMTLQEVVDLFCTTEINCLEIVQGMEPTFDEKGIQYIKEYLHTASEDLEEIQSKVKRIISDCSKLITDIKLNHNYAAAGKRFLKNITEANTFIEGKDVSSLINQFILSAGTDDIEQLYFMTNDEKKDEIISYTTTEKIYQNILEACDFIRPLVDQVVQNL